MSDDRSAERKALQLHLEVTDGIWSTLPAQTVHGDTLQVVRSFRDVVEGARSPVLQEAASLAIIILSTSQIPSVDVHEEIAQHVCSLAQHLLDAVQVCQAAMTEVLEILRKAEFLVKHQTSSHWISRGFPAQDHSTQSATLIRDILRAREALVTQDSHEGRTRSLNTGGDGTMVENQESSSPQRLLCMSRSLDEMNVLKRLYKFKGLVLTYLLKIYFLLLLNLPKFYASRIYLWARSADPAVPETCPSRRNSTNSILWLTFDERLDCDVDFCDRALTTLLREWKTFRVLSSIVFASILAMLQIHRVEQDAVISTPAYFSLLSGIMAAVSATILDLYFQTGKACPGILAWVHSLRDISEPKYFNDDSVILALPAISTAWSTLLFIMAIVAFTFEANTGADNFDEAELDIHSHMMSTLASLGFRILFLLVMIISTGFLVMMLMTLRSISKGRKTSIHPNSSDNAATRNEQ